MIYSPFTNWGAQASYDHIRKRGVTTDREMFSHAMMQGLNVVAEAYPIAALTSMSNPHRMSFLYSGIDAAKYGIRASEQSRREFQMASSKAYQYGSRFILGANKIMNAPYRIPTGTSAKLARLGGKAGYRLIPGLGWAMLAYDVYDLAANKRLLGINL